MPKWRFDARSFIFAALRFDPTLRMSEYIVARANVAVFMVLVGGVSWKRSDVARSVRDWSQHTYWVLGAIKDLNLRDAETGKMLGV